MSFKRALGFFHHLKLYILILVTCLNTSYSTCWELLTAVICNSNFQPNLLICGGILGCEWGGTLYGLEKGLTCLSMLHYPASRKQNQWPRAFNLTIQWRIFPWCEKYYVFHRMCSNQKRLREVTAEIEYSGCRSHCMCAETEHSGCRSHCMCALR